MQRANSMITLHPFRERMPAEATGEEQCVKLREAADKAAQQATEAASAADVKHAAVRVASAASAAAAKARIMAAPAPPNAATAAAVEAERGREGMAPRSGMRAISLCILCSAACASSQTPLDERMHASSSPKRTPNASAPPLSKLGTSATACCSSVPTSSGTSTPAAAADDTSKESLAEKIFAQIQHACFPQPDETTTAGEPMADPAAAATTGVQVLFTFERDPAIFDDVGGVVLWKGLNEKMKEGRLGR